MFPLQVLFYLYYCNNTNLEQQVFNSASSILVSGQLSHSFHVNFLIYPPPILFLIFLIVLSLFIFFYIIKLLLRQFFLYGPRSLNFLSPIITSEALFQLCKASSITPNTFPSLNCYRYSHHTS